MVGVAQSLNRKQRRTAASVARRPQPALLAQASTRQDAQHGFAVFEASSMDLSAMDLTAPPKPLPFVRMENAQPLAAAGIELGSVARWKKDVLRPGQFSTSDGVKNFSPADIASIVASFQLAKSRGVQVPVIMAEAGAADQHDELAGHKVGEVDDLWVDPDGTLMSSVWTASKSKSAVYQLDLLKQNTSPEIWRNWTDGAGNVYPLFLKHFAIVTHPVVHPQGSFVRLSLNRRIKMAAGDNGGVGSKNDAAATPQFTGESSLSEVFDSLKASLTDLGLLIPDDITADNLVASLQLMASIKRASQAETEPSEPAGQASGGSSSSDTAATMAAGPQPAATMALLSKANQRIAELEAAARTQAQNVFRAALSSHVKRGAITQDKANEFAKSGERMGFNLDYLAPLDAIPDSTAFPTGKTKVASMATGKPPAMGSDDSADAAKLRQEEIARRWGTATAK